MYSFKKKKYIYAVLHIYTDNLNLFIYFCTPLKLYVYPCLGKFEWMLAGVDIQDIQDFSYSGLVQHRLIQCGLGEL